MERTESAVNRANLRYSTVEAALKEIRDNMNNVRNQIHGLDDSDLCKGENWKADVRLHRNK